MDDKGQISMEYILIIGITIAIVLLIGHYSADANELSKAMTAARGGATEGANMNSFGIYPDNTFDDYIRTHPRLIGQTSIKIRKIDYEEVGISPEYNMSWIRLTVVASAPSVTDPSDQNALGDRINFYVRKSICESFNAQNRTSKLFNPAFSNKYVFTTTNVKWE